MAVDRFPVEYSHIMMFARSVGDPNPIYHDPEAAKATEPGAVIAPPTFVQSSAQFDPDYVLRERSARLVRFRQEPHRGSAGFRGGGNGGGLHAEQHYEYHRHPQAGDVLTATVKPGKSWEKQGRRGGKLLFQETITEYRDQNGDLVVTARGIGVRTERPATAEA